MTDPLAHLYAETGAGPDPEELEDLPTVTVTEEDLHRDFSDEDEELTDHDAEELALLLEADTSDANVVALGLGRWHVDDDGDRDVVLTPAGRKVLGLIIDRKHPGLRDA